MGKTVTDPALISGLDKTIAETSRHVVNDPDIISQLNSVAPEQPVDILGNNAEGNALLTSNATAPIQQTENATTKLASDFSNNLENLPDQYKHASGIDYAHPENPINKITDPHGDPAYTAGYIQTRVAQADKQYNAMLQAQRQSALSGQLPSKEEQSAFADYAKQMDELKGLKESAGHIVALQLFNKDYSTKQHTDATANTALQSLEEQRKSSLQSIDDQIASTKELEHPNGVEAVKERSRLEGNKSNINTHYNDEQRKIKDQTKYNPIRLGAEYSALMGDALAQADFEALKAGKSISPARQLKYSDKGDEIIKSGTENTVNENVKQEGLAHTDVTGNRRFENNKDYLISEGRQKIGNAKYRDENSLLHAIVPSALLPNISKADIKKYAAQEGLDERTTQELLKNPEEIPKSASILQQMGKSMVNTAAPIYEQGIRAAVGIAGGDPEAVDERFQPGWENNAGIGAVIAGNMPSEQNSFHNVRGALGQMFGGAAGLSVFAGEVGTVEKGLAGLGVAASKADRLANFGVMSFNGYNNAYHESKDVIGDKPEDESKRQAYSLIRGMAEGAIFSIHPPGQLIKNALGDIEKSGDQFLQELKNKPISEILQDKPRLAEYVVNTAKDLGTQVTLAEGSQIATNIINTIADKKKHDLDENTVETGISTALSMLIPSVMSGVRHTAMQTPLNQAAIFEVGSHPEQYMEHITQMRDDGKLTDQQANKLAADISTIAKTVQVTPTHNTDGTPLTPDQIKGYTFNLLQEQVLGKKVEALRSQAESAGIDPDKAQISPLEKGISELTKEREEILKTAGEGRPIEEQKENLALKENDISLSPDNIVEDDVNKKTDTHGKDGIQDNDRGQDGSEIIRSEENGPDTEIREPANSEGRRQQEENGLLSKEEGSKEKEKAAQNEQPSLVEAKPKKKRKKLIAEELPVESLAAKSEEIDSTQTEEQQQEVVQQSSEPEHAVSEIPPTKEAIIPADFIPSKSNKNREGDTQLFKKVDGDITHELAIKKDGTAYVTTTDKSMLSGPDEHSRTLPAEIKDFKTAPEAIKYINEFEGKPKETPQPNGAIATDANEQQEANPPKETTYKKHLKEIDEDIIRQKASQKLEATKRSKADKDNDIPAFNTHNENWHKKQDRIDALVKEKEKIVRDQREETIRASYNAKAERVQEIYEANKKNHQGIASSSILGLSHKIGDHIADFIVARFVEGIREFGNVHVLADRAIRSAKEKFGKEAKDLSEADASKVREALSGMMGPQEKEPILSLENEEYAKDLLADINSGESTYKEIVREVLDEVIENRAGKPVSENVSDKTKSQILNYIDWHTQDRDTHNSQTLRQPKYDKKYLDGYDLSKSNIVSKYLSGETLEDVYDVDVQFEKNSKQAQLQDNLVKDMSNMVGLAKSHTGSDDVTIFGPDMLDNIQKMPDGDSGRSVKKLLAVSALNNELHGERVRLEEKLKEGGPGVNDIQNRLKQIKKLTQQAEILYRDITSNASDVMNAARANRIYRDTYFQEEFASKILSEQQQADKSKMEEVLDKTDIPDKIAEQGSFFEPKEAEKEIESILAEKEKSEAGKAVESDITGQKGKEPKTTSKEKSKTVVGKLRERFKKKKETTEDPRKEVLDKKAAEQKASDYLKGSSIEDLFKKAKEQTKKPC